MTLWEDLLGVVVARRLRYGIVAAGTVMLLGGSAVFVTVSQTVGALLLGPAAFVLLMWLMFQPPGGDPVERWRRRRPWFMAVGLTSVAAGWALFLAVDGDLGLLFVLLGGISLAAVLVGATHDDRGGPSDGPWYGETSV